MKKYRTYFVAYDQTESGCTHNTQKEWKRLKSQLFSNSKTARCDGIT